MFLGVFLPFLVNTQRIYTFTPPFFVFMSHQHSLSVTITCLANFFLTIFEYKVPKHQLSYLVNTGTFLAMMLQICYPFLLM